MDSCRILVLSNITGQLLLSHVLHTHLQPQFPTLKSPSLSWDPFLMFNHLHYSVVNTDTRSDIQSAYLKEPCSQVKQLTEWMDFCAWSLEWQLFTTTTHVRSSCMCLGDEESKFTEQLRWKIYYSYQPLRGTFSFFTSCFRIAESRLKHNALQHGPRSLRRLARSSFRSKAAMLRAPSSCSKRLSASFNQNKHTLSFPNSEVSPLT